MADHHKLTKKSYVHHSKDQIQRLRTFFIKGHTKFQPERSNHVGGFMGHTNRQTDRQMPIVVRIIIIIINIIIIITIIYDICSLDS